MLLLGNWSWTNEGGASAQGGWQPPESCLGAVDLASAAQIASAKAGQPRGVGIFVCTKIPAGWDGAVLASGDLRDAKPDASILSAWKSLTGYQPSGDTLADCLWDHLTAGADPANASACGVLMPETGGSSSLWLGSRIAHKPFVIAGTDPQSQKVRQILRQQLADAKADSLAGKMRSPLTGKIDLRYYLKIADAITEKFAGKNPAKKAALLAVIKPASFDRGDVLVPHNTTLTESWTHADASDISADQTWTEVTAALQIAGNGVTIEPNKGSVGMARCEADLSSSDHYCQLEQSVGGTSVFYYWAPCARFSSSDKTCYLAMQQGGTGAVGIRRIAKFSANWTMLGSGTSGVSVTDASKIVCNGSSISVYSAGTLLETITDTTIAGNTRGGIYVTGNSLTWKVDNWEAGDLGGGGGGSPMTPYYWLMMGAGNL
jgi:hypothetical protein